MIQRVSGQNNTPSLKKSAENVKKKFHSKIDTAKPYADSFIKNAKQSTPVLLGVTAVWSIIDNRTKKVPLKKSLSNNMKGFFVPVIIFSSALLSFIENKKSSPKKK